MGSRGKPLRALCAHCVDGDRGSNAYHTKSGGSNPITTRDNHISKRDVAYAPEKMVDRFPENVEIIVNVLLLDFSWCGLSTCFRHFVLPFEWERLELSNCL